MTILENAVRHFKHERSHLKQINVTEWGEGGVPATIYFKPIMSLLEKGKILKAYQGDNPAEALAEVLIIRALDENGKPLFKQVEKSIILKSIDEEVIARVINEMQGETEDLSFEDAEKN